MSEKRKEKRIEEEIRVRIKLIPEDKYKHDKNIVYALTKDISSGGVKIVTDKRLPIDAMLKIELTLSKIRKLVQATARVRWINQLYDDDVFEMGLEFVDTPADSVMLLLEYIYGLEEIRSKK